tara:strand:+ start:275 stop:445 length:171 start_codon:yes stop_codon:yes gene_type:complete
MQIGLGVLQISPNVFWNMSFPEFYSAVQGWQEANGVDQIKPATKADVEQLMDRYPD